MQVIFSPRLVCFRAPEPDGTCPGASGANRPSLPARGGEQGPGLARRRRGRSASGAPARTHEPYSDEEDAGADEGNQDAAPKAGAAEAVIALKGPKHEAADKGPDQAHHDVAEQAEAAALH